MDGHVDDDGCSGIISIIRTNQAVDGTTATSIALVRVEHSSATAASDHDEARVVDRCVVAHRRRLRYALDHVWPLTNENGRVYVCSET